LIIHKNYSKEGKHVEQYVYCTVVIYPEKAIEKNKIKYNIQR